MAIDLSEFHALATRKKKPPCQVGVALAALNGESDTLGAALAKSDGDDEIRPGAISKWLEKRGHPVTVSAIRSHRDRTCSCAVA